MKSVWGRVAARISPRERRALVLGLCIVVPALFIRIAARPYLLALSAVDERLARERELLKRELSVLGEAKWYPGQAEAVEAALLARAPRLFGGTDLLSAAAGLSGYVAARAVEHRVFVQHSEARVVPASGETGLATLELDIQAVGDLEGITGLVFALEGGSKLVSVERLALAGTDRAGLSGDNDGALRLAATVVGYALAPEPR